MRCSTSRARRWGSPVHSLLGGPFRNGIPLYWSHCGTYRVRHASLLGVAPLRSFDDVAKLGAEVRQRGFRALKTGLMGFTGDGFTNFAPAFAHSPEYPELNVDRDVLAVLARQFAAFREGAGPDMEILLDVNFHFKTEGFLEVVRTVEPFGLVGSSR